MDNQHRKIAGYRELSAAEIQLINDIKQLGAQLEQKVIDVLDHLRIQRAVANGSLTSDPAEVDRLDRASPERWASIGRTHLQEGLMALTRAVAQPGSF